ncbi:hypothetical protein GCM10027040_00760 [Halomonas shantousis]
MERQRGAALIIVLVLLTVSIMLGISSMQSSLIDERMAGNYRESTQAQMAAEAGLSVFNDVLQQNSVLKENLASWAHEGSDNEFSLDGFHYNKLLDKHSSLEILRVMKVNDHQFFVESEGRSGAYKQGKRETKRVAVAYYNVRARDEGGLSGYTACENLNLNIDLIDSYDSRVGSYGGSNARHSLADIGVTSPKGTNVNITRGGTQIYGNLVSRSDIAITGGGSSITGNVQANGNVSVSGSSSISGNIVSGGSVRLNQSNVGGDIVSVGDITMEGWGATVNGNVTSGENLYTGEGGLVKGNAAVAGSVNTAGWDKRIYGLAQAKEFISAGGGGVDRQVPNRELASISPVDVDKLESQDCDFVNLKEAMLGLSTVQSSNDLIVNNGKEYKIHPGMNGSVVSNDNFVFMGEESSVIRLSSLSVGGGAYFEVNGGKPIVLFIDGDVDIGDGATFKVSGKGTSLKIVTNGRFKQSLDRNKFIIDVSTSSGSNVVDDSNSPVLSLYTTKDVDISGDAKFYGAIYAPYSEVRVQAGGGFYGAMHAKSLNVSGGGGAHFDEALLEDKVDGGGKDRGVEVSIAGYCYPEYDHECAGLSDESL